MFRLQPGADDEGFTCIPEHASIGLHAGPMFGALGILAGVLRARETGEGCMLEIGQSDAAAYMDWYRIESWKAYERPESAVTGSKDGRLVDLVAHALAHAGRAGRAPHVVVGRPARHVRALARLLMPYPVKFLGEKPEPPGKAPTVGEHSDDVLGRVLGYDAGRIAAWTPHPRASLATSPSSQPRASRRTRRRRCSRSATRSGRSTASSVARRAPSRPVAWPRDAA